MKKVMLFVLFIAFSVLFTTSCKKDSGQGGRASIKGKVWVRKHDPAYSVVVDSYASADDDVYIIYGNETTYGDRQKTTYTGDFEFKYLRKGSYKIYVYSDDSAKLVGPPSNPFAPKIAVVKEVTITERKQTVDAGTIIVLH